MTQTFGGMYSHDFAYVTVDQLRAEGILADKIPDDRAKKLILLAGGLINWITQQWFIPLRLIQKVDGRATSVFHLPSFVPILDLFDLRVGKVGLFEFSLPSISYQVKERHVAMLDPTAKMSGQPLFMILDGVFGWLEKDFEPVVTTLAAPANMGDKTLTLASVDRIRSREVLLIGNEVYPGSITRIIDGVRGTDVIVDSIESAFPIGTKVVKYGRVPLEIQWATMLLVKDKATTLGVRGTEDDGDSPKWFAERLTSESVEGYSYGLDSLPVKYGFLGGQARGKNTGNPEVDDILARFSCPYLYLGCVYA